MVTTQAACAAVLLERAEACWASESAVMISPVLGQFVYTRPDLSNPYEYAILLKNLWAMSFELSLSSALPIPMTVSSFLF